MTSFGFRGKCGRWLAGALLACLGMPAIAATYTVTNTNDAGAGSLRQAMLSAIASPAADTIVFAPSSNGVITLQSALPDLLGSGGALTITGNGAANTIIDGAGQYRPFKAEWQDGLRFTLRGLTVRNGFADQGQGGAIFMQGGNSTTLLTLDAVELVGNLATYNGGAVYVSTPVRIDDSLFAGNRSGTYGGGIHFDGGQTARVRNTTFDGNVGGVICVTGSGSANDPVARFVNVTATGDRPGDDAVLRIEGGARASLSNSLIGGSIPSIRLYDTGAIELATSFNNVLKNPLDSGIQDGVNGNQINVILPLIGPLGDHGGLTRTLPLLPGSPALDAGTEAGGDVPAADQRGVARVGPPDVGAYESHGFSVAIGSGNGQSTAVGTPFAESLVAVATALDPLEPVAGGIVRFSAPTSGPSAVITSPDATIESDGTAPAAAIANGVVGGPYAVSARLSAAQSVDFSLTNVAGACGAFAFPYTLAGADNAARVAELRQAIECANVNASDDEIDLGGHTLVFADAPYTDANGANALPIATSVLTLRNGALERDASAAAFRFLDAATGSDLRVRAMQLRNGASDTEGGAIRADGALKLEDSVFEDNRAATLGGAISSHAMTNIFTSRFTRNVAPDGAAIAGGDDDAIPGSDVTLVANSRIENNGDAASRSVIWNKSYFAMVASLVADNHLSAANSSLMFFHEDAAVAEFRNVTIADNTVTGALFLRMSANMQLNNCIVWDNQYGSLGAVSARNSILPGVPAVSGNLDQPPGFVGAGDYHLDSGSPAIDAADNGYGYPIGDLDQNPRPVDDPGVADTGVSHNGDPILDIGAYERQTASAVAGITVTPTSGLITTEAGGTATFTVVLDRYPKADVTLPLSSSDVSEGVVAPASLIFTQANWNQPRTITVTGMDDGVIDGDQGYTIVTGPAGSADPAYDGIDPPDVSVVNEEGAIPQHHLGGTVIGLAGSGLVLSFDEAGETLPVAADGSFVFAATLAQGATYTVTIAAQPQTPAQACVVVNGSGTMGGADVGNVVVNCGATDTRSIGGSVSGLAGGGLVLQLNGGGDLAISANGGYAFPLRLLDGASYIVTVKTQPQGQLCTLDHATGTVQGADVSDVDASCAPLAAELHLGVDDGHAFARYGHVRDYFVTLGNSGNAAANGIQVVGTFSAAFDVANVHWQCLGGASLCGSGGAGGFSDAANLPANSSVTWIVSVPVLGGSDEAEATFRVDVAPSPVAANGAGLWDADTDTLVIFRDGHDVLYGDGSRAPEPLPLYDERSVPIEWPPASGEGITLVRTLATPEGDVLVQRLTLGSADFVRLLGTDGTGQQRPSDWARVADGAHLAVARVAGATNISIVLLEGAARPLAVSQHVAELTGELE